MTVTDLQANSHLSILYIFLQKLLQLNCLYLCFSLKGNILKLIFVEASHKLAVYTLQRQLRLYIPFLGIARPLPHFPHSCVFERFIHSQDQSTYFLQQTHRGNIKFAHRHMKVEIRTEAPIFLFWEYLFQIFGILSLQCIYPWIARPWIAFFDIYPWRARPKFNTL